MKNRAIIINTDLYLLQIYKTTDCMSNLIVYGLTHQCMLTALDFYSFTQKILHQVLIGILLHENI